MYMPKKQELALFRSMASDVFSTMVVPATYADGTIVPQEDLVALANLQGAVRFLGRLGALDERWLKKIGARPSPRG